MSAILVVAVVLASYALLTLMAAAVVIALARLGLRARSLCGARFTLQAIVVAVTATVVLPAFLLFEPLGQDEEASGFLLLLAGLGFVLACAGPLRLLLSASQAMALRAAWRRGEGRAEGRMTMRLVDHPFPVVAVTGLWRPRLYVARQVLKALDGDELAAVLAHEEAHVAGRDNVWLAAVIGCPDVFSLVPTGRAMERDLHAALEARADARAASSGPGRAHALASALIKVARLTPPGARLRASFGAISDGGDGLAHRIQGLLEEPAPSSSARPVTGAWLGAAAVALLISAAMHPSVLQGVHGLCEALVKATS